MSRKGRSWLLVGNLLLIVFMTLTLLNYISNSERDTEAAAVEAMQISVENLASTSRVYFTAQTQNIKNVASYMMARDMDQASAFDYLSDLRGNGGEAVNGYAIFSRSQKRGRYVQDGQIEGITLIPWDPMYKLIDRQETGTFDIQAVKGVNPYDGNQAIIFYAELTLTQDAMPVTTMTSDSGYYLCYFIDEVQIVESGLTEPNLAGSSSLIVDSSGTQVVKSSGNNIGSSYENIYKYFDAKAEEPEAWSDVSRYTGARVKRELATLQPFLETISIKRVNAQSVPTYFYFVPLEKTAGWYYIAVIPVASLNAELDYTLPFLLMLFMVAFLVMNVAIVLKQNKRLNQSLIAVNQAREEADQANRSKSIFLSNMSHDIRTPMNAIVGMSEIARQAPNDPEKVEDCLQKINASSQLLLSIINDVLDMSRIESGKVTLRREAFSLRDFTAGMQMLIQPQTDAKKQHFEVAVAELMEDGVVADHLRMEQVMVNILANAVKYTHEGGHIRLSVRQAPAERPERVLCVFDVRDDGIGMSETFLKHIFEPFSRENRSEIEGIQGTGLGMSITKNYVTMMQGDIQVESREGEGSRFVVTLPLERQSACTDAAVEHIDLGGRAAQRTTCDLSGLHLLAAEDHPLNREIIRKLLERTHATLDIAENGRVCVERFAASAPGTYAAVLMDIQMPEMNGYEAAAAIRALDRPDARSVVIIAMTANAFSEDIQKAMEAGMNAHIAKPIDIGILNRTLSQLVTQREEKGS